MKLRRSAHCRSVSLYCRHCSSAGSATASGCGSAGGGMAGKGRGAEPRQGRAPAGPGRVRRDQAPRVDQAAARCGPPGSAGPAQPQLHLTCPRPGPVPLRPRPAGAVPVPLPVPLPSLVRGRTARPGRRRVTWPRVTIA